MASGYVLPKENWSEPTNRKLWSRKDFKRNIEGWIWTSPWLIGMILFTIAPMAISLYWSFCHYDIVNPAKWIGLTNYIDIFSDPMVATSLRNTIYFAGVSVPLGLILGLLLAVIVNQNVKGISVWRTIYYLPAIISTVAYAQLWKFLLNRDYGLINNFLGLFNIKGPDWFSQTWIIPAFILLSIWTMGGSMIINLAGLQSIPTEYYDAAKVDGASGIRLLRHITLPLITPTIFYNLVMGIIAAFQSFTIFFVITSDPNAWMAPSNIGMVYMVYLYKNAFFLFQMGYGSALAWILFIIILVLTLLIFRTAKSWVHYGNE